MTRLWVVVLMLLALTGCGGHDVAPPPSPPVDEREMTPAGARELADPLTRLVLVEQGSGVTAVYDVIDETETPLGEFGPIDAVSGDGRFGYLHARDRLTVVDAGAWTVDHGDHKHYYAAEPAVAGTVDQRVEAITAHRAVAAIRTADGRIDLLDRERLGRRDVGAPDTAGIGELTGIAAAAPYGKGLLIVTESGQLQVVDDKGALRPLPAQCPAATGATVLRRAVIVGCRDGAVRVGGSDAAPAATRIPLPDNGPDDAIGPLERRDRDGVLAAIAGDEVWVLDSGQRNWSSMTVPGVVAASTADGLVLVLTRDGVLRAFDTAAGTETASVALLPAGVPADRPAPVIAVDPERAYVNDAAAQAVYEIDYSSGLRLARTLHTEVEPSLMVEAGR
jgi:putative pyrroloquinoline-quinone-binding quinoprotein